MACCFPILLSWPPAGLTQSEPVPPETLHTPSSWLPWSLCHRLPTGRVFFSFGTSPVSISLPPVQDPTVHLKEVTYCMKLARLFHSRVSAASSGSLSIILLHLVNLSPAFFLQNCGCMITHLSGAHQIYGALLKCHKSTTMSHLALSSIATYQRYLKIEGKVEKGIYEYVLH